MHNTFQQKRMVIQVYVYVNTLNRNQGLQSFSDFEKMLWKFGYNLLKFGYNLLKFG